MNKFYLILFLVLAAGCRQKTQPAAVQKNAVTHKAPVKQIADTVNSEYIDYTKFKLQGKLPFFITYASVKHILGEPDSVVKPGKEEGFDFYYDKPFSYVYFKGIKYEKYKDTLIFRSVDFKEAPLSYIMAGVLKLTALTKAAVLEKQFPKAFSNELSGTDMDKHLVVRLATSKRFTDDAWILYFDRNTDKLLSFEYWVPL